MVGSINISILMNSAGDEWEMDKSIRPNTMPRELYSDRRFYATRDIRKDEEILTDYDVYTTRWYEIFGPFDDKEHLDEEEEEEEVSYVSEYLDEEEEDEEVSYYISDFINTDETTWPTDWEWMPYDYIWNVLDCAPLRDDPNKPLPTIEDWTTMREVYTQVVEPAKKFLDPIPPTMGYTYGKSEDGEALPPPYYARTSPGKGRGLFASRNIKRGEVVHRGGHESDVVFPDGMSWRRYIFTLPNRLACSISDWNWTQRLEDGGPLRMIVNLNVRVAAVLRRRVQCLNFSFCLVSPRQDCCVDELGRVRGGGRVRRGGSERPSERPDEHGVLCSSGYSRGRRDTHGEPFLYGDVITVHDEEASYSSRHASLLQDYTDFETNWAAVGL